jgi:DNA mismatch endonuclease (patch repair protein)
MRAVKSRDTSPELAVRALLRPIAPGYRLHRGDLPGKPDIVYASRKLAIFVHGCFWHGHDCRFFRLPGTRPEFWQKKIESNRARDAVVAAQLRAADWRWMVIWECAIRGQNEKAVERVSDRAAAWLESGKRTEAIRGH